MEQELTFHRTNGIAGGNPRAVALTRSPLCTIARCMRSSSRTCNRRWARRTVVNEYAITRHRWSSAIVQASPSCGTLYVKSVVEIILINERTISYFTSSLPFINYFRIVMSILAARCAIERGRQICPLIIKRCKVKRRDIHRRGRHPISSESGGASF